MYDLISIGGISIDLYFSGASLTLKDQRFQLAVGGKYVSDYFHVGLGGGGANVAIGASKNGLKVAVMGKVGNNSFRQIILKKLEERNISHTLCDTENNYYNISTVLLSPLGERTIIHYVTPHQHLVSDKNELKGLSKSKMVYFGNLPDVSFTQRLELLTYFKSKNIFTFLNLGVRDCRRTKEQLNKILSHVDALIINGHEFADLVKAPYKDIHFKENVVKWYVPDLQDKIVVVTEGRKGSYGYYNNKVIHQPAIDVDEIIDSTGAGDGYTAAFISEFHKTKDLEKSMEKASHYAAKILQRIGAN